jgi:hypothetical protein
MIFTNKKPSPVHHGEFSFFPVSNSSCVNTSTLNPESSSLNPQSSTLNPQPSILNPQSSTLNPESSTLTNLKISNTPSKLNSQSSKLYYNKHRLIQTTRRDTTDQTPTNPKTPPIWLKPTTKSQLP